ncbi:MAG: hypothetical protein DRP54_02075 [Spirochaetes bacterium]|nr:MAG: hypothetical protein DRP54_02075 [Spirochaetota bacterium]
MDNSYMKLIESRINKAIAFIEELKNREKSLKDEKEGLKKVIINLENELKKKDERIEELLEIQKFLKDKIELVLSRLESIDTTAGEEDVEKLESAQDTFEEAHEVPLEEKDKNDESEETIVEGPIVIEEEFVDLSKEKDEASIGETDGKEAQEKREAMTMKDESTASAGEGHTENYSLFEQSASESAPERKEDPVDETTSDSGKKIHKNLKMKSEWIWSNPFIDS